MHLKFFPASMLDRKQSNVAHTHPSGNSGRAEMSGSWDLTRNPSPLAERGRG
jgi:hypothetical protein